MTTFVPFSICTFLCKIKLYYVFTKKMYFPFFNEVAFISWHSKPIRCTLCWWWWWCADCIFDGFGVNSPNYPNTADVHCIVQRMMMSRALTVLTWSIELHHMKRHSHVTSDSLAAVSLTMSQCTRQSTNLYLHSLVADSVASPLDVHLNFEWIKKIVTWI